MSRGAAIRDLRKFEKVAKAGVVYVQLTVATRRRRNNVLATLSTKIRGQLEECRHKCEVERVSVG